MSKTNVTNKNFPNLQKKIFEEREGDEISVDECQGKDNNARSTDEKSVLVSNMS